MIKAMVLSGLRRGCLEGCMRARLPGGDTLTETGISSKQSRPPCAQCTLTPSPAPSTSELRRRLDSPPPLLHRRPFYFAAASPGSANESDMAGGRYDGQNDLMPAKDRFLSALRECVVVSPCWSGRREADITWPGLATAASSATLPSTVKAPPFTCVASSSAAIQSIFARFAAAA